MDPPRLPHFYQLSPEVSHARSLGLPLVALESAVITHGLPFPDNTNLAQDMESEVRQQGATPATIAVLDGRVQVGLSLDQLDRLVSKPNLRKVGPRDFTRMVVKYESGGTTVAGTLLVAHAAGIQVFATGGIGGVHRQAPQDVSADLPQLARTPLIVVCAGAKSILDLPATLEYLETYSIPVVGYQTDEFPAFYVRTSGLQASVRADSADEVVLLARTHWQTGAMSAVLVAVPPPREAALPQEQAEQAIEQSLREARQQGIRGQAVTPFLLRRVSELTGRASLAANVALLRNNAQVAGQIAQAMQRGTKISRV
jgi:pseudouridine-5'-phosphate glycosidase